MRDKFQQAKESVLARKDKSHEQAWDEKIKPLCDLINKKPQYYTTSSCAGRIMLILDSDEKDRKIFLFKTHNLSSFEELKKELDAVGDKDLVFKQDCCILHIVCKTLEDAQDLIEKAKFAGWKKSGIIGTNEDKFVAELISTEKLELPIVINGKILVDDNYLRILIEKANQKLEKTWEKIKKLENELSIKS